VILGGAIGMERELKGKPAGLRTNILICLGATIIADVSVALAVAPDGSRIGDPARLAAQVVTGVGFLGAGTILHSAGVVTGLTSAATIWVVAAIGIAIGAGQFVEATGAGALVTLVLAGLGRVEHRLRRASREVSLTVRARPETPLEVLREVLANDGLRIVSHRMYDHPRDRTFELRVRGPAVQFEFITASLLERTEVLSVHGL
jgi:putative Mg2+ transporter-C (MgtC) family protein